MGEQLAGRFEVVVESGSPRGDLFELEQKTYYQVVDRHTKQIILEFESLMEASLSRDTGMWDDYRFSGVCEVSVAPDEQSVIVKYHDGVEEMVPLPK
ncbi:MAG TPA: hypothetical protein VLY63_24850 [Anaerolineae bacterium]|nr:hypothetical protein [Anaerolineae bacterium]